jgi:hypothetical protein
MKYAAKLKLEMHVSNIVLKFVDEVEDANANHGGYTRSHLQGRAQVVAMEIIDAVRWTANGRPFWPKHSDMTTSNICCGTTWLIWAMRMMTSQKSQRQKRRKAQKRRVV